MIKHFPKMPYKPPGYWARRKARAEQRRKTRRAAKEAKRVGKDLAEDDPTLVEVNMRRLAREIRGQKTTQIIQVVPIKTPMYVGWWWGWPGVSTGISRAPSRK